MSYTRTQIEAMGLATGWGSRSRDMSYVAMAESSGDANIVNSIGCVGLLQINQPVHVKSHPTWTRAWLQNPINNLRAGLVLYKAAGEKFDGPWLDSRDKGSGGGWGKYVKGSGTGGTGATQVDVNCDDMPTEQLKKNCEQSQNGGDIPFDPNDPGASGGDIFALVSQVGRIAQATARAGEWIANPENWIRVVYVVGGGILAIAAVNMVARPYVNPAIQAVRQVIPTETVKKVRKMRSGT